MYKVKDIKTGDFFSFKSSDKQYRVIFCIGQNTQVSPHSFSFAATSIGQTTKPTLNDIRSSFFFGKGNRNSYKYSGAHIDKMWTIHPEIKPYFLGTYGLIIWKKDLRAFWDKFEFLFNLPIPEQLMQNGSGAINASSLEVLNDLFVTRLVSFMDSQGQITFKTEALIEE